MFVHESKKFKGSVYIPLVSNLVVQVFFAITEQKICEMYPYVCDASWIQIRLGFKTAVILSVEEQG